MERMTTCKKVVHWMNVLIPLFRSIVQILPIAILCFIIIKNKEFAIWKILTCLAI